MRPPDDPSARARSRRGWPVQRARLGQESPDDLATRATPEERVLMMWPLARDVWTMSGKPMPSYRREEAPVRWLRPGTRHSGQGDE